MDTKPILKQINAIDLEAIGLREQISGLNSDLVKARKVVADESAAGVRALVQKLTHNPAKLAAARTQAELLPQAIAQLTRQLVEVEGPLQALQLQLARNAADEKRAAIERMGAELLAELNALGPKWDTFCKAADALAQTDRAVLPGYSQNAIRRLAMSLTGIGQAVSVADYFEHGGY